MSALDEKLELLAELEDRQRHLVAKIEALEDRERRRRIDNRGRDLAKYHRPYRGRSPAARGSRQAAARRRRAHDRARP